MSSEAVWLEVIRIFLGLLILLALSTLYKIFRNTKVIDELNLITLGFILYTMQAAMGAYQSFGNPMPIVWKTLELDEFIEALMFVVFAIAAVRVKRLFDILKLEERLYKMFREVFG